MADIVYLISAASTSMTGVKRDAYEPGCFFGFAVVLGASSSTVERQKAAIERALDALQAVALRDRL